MLPLDIVLLHENTEGSNMVSMEATERGKSQDSTLKIIPEQKYFPAYSLM